MGKHEGYRNWCFTAWTEPQYDYENSMCSYCIFQKEKCPKTGKIHWQGYAEFSDKVSMQKVKEIFGDGTMRLAPRYGSQFQAVEYCYKLASAVGECIECGTLKDQGHRGDLDTLWEAIESGSTCREILIEHKGSALRHINLIRRGLQVFHQYDYLDNLILQRRKAKKEAEEIDADLENPIEVCYDHDKIAQADAHMDGIDDY